MINNDKKLVWFAIIDAMLNKLIWFSKSILKASFRLIESLFLKIITALDIKLKIDLPVEYQWNKIIKNSGSNLKKENYTNKKKKVLFLPIYGFSDAHLGYDSLFAKSLQLRGVETHIVSCSSILPACQWNPDGNGSIRSPSKNPKFKINKLDQCRYCQGRIESLSKSSGINNHELSDFIDENDLEDARRFLDQQEVNFEENIIYNQVNISEHARSTTLRVQLRGTLEADEYTKKLYSKYLISGIILIKALMRLFKATKPNSVCMVHGIYLEHGIATDLAKSIGIDVFVWGVPYRKDTIQISKNDTYHREIMEEPNEVWMNNSLSDFEKNRLEKYTSSKLIGGRDNVNYHPNPILDQAKIMSQLGLVSDKPIVSLFTNVLWDAQIFYSSNIFDGLLDWIFESIKFSIENNIQLAVRIHPAESKGGFTTRQPIAKEILDHFKVLPKNISIIKPQSDISSYVLSDISDLSVVYGSNIALELGLMGRKLMIVGESKSKGKGFSVDPKSKEDYFRYLMNPELLNEPTDSMKELAQKFANHLYFKRWIDLGSISTPISGKNTTRTVQFNFQQLESILPGNDPGLDKICNMIIDDE